MSSFQILLAAIVCVLCITGNAQDKLLTPVEHQRPADQTWLTFPEWFLVYSPAEYAEFTHDHDASQFPFTGHIRQFWDSYAAISAEASQAGEQTNYAYHTMIMVIGISTTAEYAFRSAYETLIGRLSLLTRRHGPTPEDRFAANTAQEYVAFLDTEPWYKFDFLDRLQRLWTDTGWWGNDPLRKWERKYILTTEYSIKAAYGWLIGQATAAGYEAPEQVTAVVVSNISTRQLRAMPWQLLDDGSDASQSIVMLPRYQAFTDAALTLARQQAEFDEVAGNRGEILISLLVPAGWTPEAISTDYSLVLSQPILTRRNTQRHLIKTTIAQLADLLRQLDNEPIIIEHIYDY